MKIDLLKPKVKQLALQLQTECRKQNLEIVFTQTLRTIAEQDVLYAKGRTAPGNIVTNARGGFSFHNYGVAFDIAPLVNGEIDWNDLNLFKKAGAVGKSLGLEWGGDWPDFRDWGHFQFSAGYSLEDFRANRVDWNKFLSEVPDTAELIKKISLLQQLVSLYQKLLELLKGRK